MMGVFYSVYKKPEDIPIAIYKNRIQCAAAMGVKVGSFDSIASNNRHGRRTSKKWEMIRCDEEEDDE